MQGKKQSTALKYKRRSRNPFKVHSKWRGQSSAQGVLGTPREDYRNWRVCGDNSLRSQNNSADGNSDSKTALDLLPLVLKTGAPFLPLQEPPCSPTNSQNLAVALQVQVQCRTKERNRRRLNLLGSRSILYWRMRKPTERLAEPKSTSKYHIRASVDPPRRSLCALNALPIQGCAINDTRVMTAPTD